MKKYYSPAYIGNVLKKLIWLKNFEKNNFVEKLISKMNVKVNECYSSLKEVSKYWILSWWLKEILEYQVKRFMFVSLYNMSGFDNISI